MVTSIFMKELELGRCVHTWSQKGTVYRAQLEQLEPRQLTGTEDLAHNLRGVRMVSFS